MTFPPHKQRILLGFILLGFLFAFVLFQCKQLRSSFPKKLSKHTKDTKEKTKGTNTQKAPVRLVPLHQRFNKNQTFAFIIPHLKPVPGVGEPRAENCKKCHTAIYDEWKQSTHASALKDLQFQAELAKPSSPKWVCLNCHIPILNQRKSAILFLSNGNVFAPVKKKNPHYDPVMRKEAITCATCHVRPDSQGNSVIIGSIGSKEAPHPIRKDPQFLKSICLRCHNPQGHRLTRHLMCWFRTHDELSKAPITTKKDCVSCHMPTTKRRLVPAWKHLTQRTSHLHHWVGGGIPKSYSHYKGLLKRGYIPGVDIKLYTPEHFEKKTTLPITLSIHNMRSGHWMPTADPERFVLLLAFLEHAKGKRSQLQKMRIGQTWEWEPKAKKLADNRLKPHETRYWKPRFKLPINRVGVTLKILVYHVRLSTKTARHIKKEATSKKLMFPSNIRKKLLQFGRHYPFATLLFREDIDLQTQKHTQYSRKQLLQLSFEERKKTLTQRDY